MAIMIPKLRQSAYKIARKSERYLKTDVVYLAKSSFWITFGQVITLGSSFILALLFARLVPKEIYGNYKYILSLIGLAAVFSLSGLSQGVLQSVARGFYGTFFEAVRLSLRWNSIMFVLLLSGGGYYLANGNDTLGYSLILASFTFPLIKTLEMYEPVLNGSRNFKKSMLFRGAVDVGTITATAISIFFTSNVVILVAVNLLTQVLLNAIFFRKVYISIFNKDKTIETETIRSSRHLSLQYTLSSAASYLDKIIIFHFIGATGLAIYSFAIAMPQQIKGLVATIPFIATPKISERSLKESTKSVPRHFFYGLVFLIPIAILYIIFSPWLMKVFFPAYVESVPYSQLFVLVILLMGNTSDIVLTTQNKIKYRYILSTFGSVSQIILMLILVHPFKIYGIIWAYLISKYLSAILSYILVKKAAKNSPE